MRHLFIVLLVLIAGCGQTTTPLPTYNHLQKNEIKESLVEMLAQSNDPFLIVEEPKTQKFIQFYNENGRILIDRPDIGLTPAEMTAAKTYFARCGISLKTTEDRDPKTLKLFVSKSWMKTYPREEIDTAVNVGIGALVEIFGFSDSVQLKLNKGWK